MFYFLKDDFDELNNQIQQIYHKIKELGKEQGEAAKQSTENFGHDDGCQESIDHQRRLTLTRLNDLKKIILHAIVITPKKTFDIVKLGATVELSDGKIIKIGSYMIIANHNITNISYDSPLGKALMNKSEGEEIEFREKRFIIKHIT